MPRRHRSLVAALASAPFASPSSPASPIHRPRSEHGQIGQAPLVRFRLFPSAFAGRAVPSEVTSLRTIPLRRFSGPGTHAKGSARPCGFSRLASPVLSISRCGDAARAGHSWPVLCTAHVPDSRIGQLSRPDRDRQSPGDARGVHILPFAVLLSSAGDGAFQRVAPTCRFATCRREFHRRGVHLSRLTKGLWPRLLGFSPARTNRAV
jgi:hypothetical protein